MHSAVFLLLIQLPAPQAQRSTTLPQAPAATPATRVAEPPAVFHGFNGQVKAQVPRVEEARVTVDGRLDEPVWAAATILTGFSQYSPADGLPADDSTEVLVWYAPNAIYFGIRAFETHGKVNATLADRDKIDADDRVEILLDTFNDKRM